MMFGSKWFKTFTKVNKTQFVFSILTLFMITFSSIALMFTSGYLISRSAQRPENILMIYVPIVLTRAFGIGRPVFRYAQRLISHNWVLKVVSLSRQRLFDLVEQNTTVISRGQSTSKTLSIMNNDIDKLQNFYLRSIFPMLAGIMMYLFLMIFTSSFSWVLLLFWTLVIIINGIIIPIVVYGLAKSNTKQLKDSQIVYGQSTSRLVSGFFEWQINGDTPIQKEISKHYKDLSEKTVASKELGWRRDFVIQMVMMSAIIGTILITGLLIPNIDINLVGAFTLSALVVGEVFTSLNAGSAEMPYFEDSFKNLDSLKENTTQKEVVKFKKFDMKVNDVSFAYGEKNIIKDISLDIPYKKKIAIIGRSGSGKTTLIKLITGDLIPNSGSVTIDNHETAKVDLVESGVMGILDQKPYLFNQTIAQNIRLVNPKLSDKKIYEYLQMAGLGQLIDSLPEGINTQLEEMGSRFSGGEQQRIALARVLAKDTPIVILDEPTVSLDPITETQVLNTIFKTLKDKTIIWITHHQIGLKHVDEIVEL